MKKILVGIDFSKPCRAALRRAAWIGHRFQAGVVALHVVRELPYEGATQQAHWVELVSRLEEEAREGLNQFVQETLPEEEGVETLVEVGVPYRDLLRIAQELGAELLVVGSETQRGIRRVFLGGTAESVAQKSSLPVWIEHVGREGDVRQILIPTDLSERSRTVTVGALDWARRLSAGVHLVHVVDTPIVPAFSLIDTSQYGQQLSDVAKKHFDQFIETLPMDGIEAQSHLTMGDPSHEITKLAEEKKTDLIILSTHGRTGSSEKSMGTTAQKILRQAPCHLLLMRPNAPRLI